MTDAFLLEKQSVYDHWHQSCQLHVKFCFFAENPAIKIPEMLESNPRKIMSIHLCTKMKIYFIVIINMPFCS